MSEETTAIYLNDVDDEDSFPVYIYSNVIPRVGDYVHYWVDYPTHMTRERRGLKEVEDGEPQKITGKVADVTIEYRVMDYSSERKLVTNVSVFLSDYKVTLYPKVKRIG
jgi:hypothetical protein